MEVIRQGSELPALQADDPPDQTGLAPLDIGRSSPSDEPGPVG